MRDPRHYNRFAKFSQKKIAANKDNSSYTIGPSGQVYDGTPEIMWNDLVFIKDSKTMWTHGQLYSFVGATYIWLSKTVLPFYVTQSEWAEEGVDASPEGGVMLETIYGQAFYGDSPEPITGVEMKPTSGISLDGNIGYEDDHKTAIIRIKVDGISLTENTDVVFTFYSEHCPEGRNALLTIVPTINGKDGDRGDVGPGVGLFRTEYFANSGGTPGDVEGFETATAAGFGAEKPNLWSRVLVYSTEAILINQPAWSLVGHYAANGKDVEVEYSPDGVNWYSTYNDGCIYMRFKKENGMWGDPIKVVGEDGSDGEYTDYSFGISQYLRTTNSLTGPSDVTAWLDAPQQVTEAKPYLWMRSIRWIWNGSALVEETDNGQKKYFYTRLTGEAGVSPLVVDLSNEMTSIPVDLNNVVVGEKRIQLEAHAFIGTKEQDIDGITMTAISGLSLVQGAIKNKPTLVIADGTTMQDTTDVELSVKVGSETRKAIFSIAAVKSHNGKDAELFELAPRKSSLSFGRDTDNNLTPDSLKEEVRIKWIKGYESGVVSVGKDKVSHLTAKYGYNEDETTHTAYNSSTMIVVSNTDAKSYDTLYLSLWNGSQLIDRESIPLLKDGTNGTNGVTPHVGDDGYWYFGDEKTDTKAEPDKPGVWTIGENGNWFYNDTDSGKKAIATDGQGVSVSYAFRRSATTLGSSDKPTGGSYANQQPDAASIAKGWSDTVPNGTNPVYMSQRTFTSDGEAPQSSEWTIPCLMVDTADIDICYSAQETKPSAPTTHGAQDGPIWHQDLADAVWMAVSSKTGGTWSDWSITKIKGEKGEDGKSPIVVDLDNEMTSIPVGQNGEVTKDGGFELELSIKAYLGTTAFKIKSVSCTPPSYATFTPNVDAANPTTNAKPRIKFAKGAVPAEVTDFEISVVLENDETRTVTYTVAAVKSGGKGENATIQELLPSPTQISFYRDANNNLAPASRTVSLKIKDVDGNTVREKEVSQTTLVVRYSFTEMPSSKTAGSSWNGSLNVTNEDAKTYSNLYIAAFNQSDVLIDRETLPIIKDGQKGADGVSPIVVDLENEMTSIPINEQGLVDTTKGYIEIPLKINAFVGTTQANITGVSAKIGNTALNGTSGDIRFIVSGSAYSTPTVRFMNGVKPSELTEISITVSVEGATRTVVFSVAAVKSGGKGEDAELYDIFATPNAIVFNRDANGNLTPNGTSNQVAVLMRKTKGSSPSVVDDIPTNIKVCWAYDRVPEAFNSTNELKKGSNTKTVSVSDAGSHSSLCIAAFVGAVMIDRETIPIIKDGQDGQDGQDGEDGKDGKDAVTLDIDNEMDSVPCDVNGHPIKETVITTNVRLYVGATAHSITANVNASALCGVNAAITYANGVATVKWTLKSNITLEGRYTSAITYVYGGVTYSATFTLAAVRAGLDGKSPTIYNVLPSLAAISFACLDGENYTPNSISITCGYTKQVGDEAITSVANQTTQIDGKYIIYYRIIATSGGVDWTQYASALTIDKTTTASRYDFCIAKGSPTTATNIIDIEGVPVTRDGKRGEKGDDGKDGAGAIRENLFGVDVAVKDLLPQIASIHTEKGLFTYNNAKSNTKAVFCIDGICDGDFFVQLSVPSTVASNIKIGKVTGTTFSEVTKTSSNGIISGKVEISGDERIAIKTGDERVEISNLKVEDAEGITAPTAYIKKRTSSPIVIKENLFSADSWTKVGVTTLTSGLYNDKYTTYSISSSGYFEQSLSNLKIGTRYCVSFYVASASAGKVEITGSIGNIYYCNLATNKYGYSNVISYIQSDSAFKLCKVIFVASQTNPKIKISGSSKVSLIKIEEGETRTPTNDEINKRDLSSADNANVAQQLQVSYDANSIGMSAGVVTAAKYESGSSVNITTPGIATLQTSQTDVVIDISSFKDGDTVRLICNNSTITNTGNKMAVVNGDASGILMDDSCPIVVFNSNFTDTFLKTNFSMTNHLHKVTIKDGASINGCGILVPNAENDKYARVSFVGAKSLYFAGGVIELVYMSGNLWLRMANALDYFVDYGGLNESNTTIYFHNGSTKYYTDIGRIIERVHFGDRIQYIVVRRNVN